MHRSNTASHDKHEKRNSPCGSYDYGAALAGPSFIIFITFTLQIFTYLHYKRQSRFKILRSVFKFDDVRTRCKLTRFIHSTFPVASRVFCDDSLNEKSSFFREPVISCKFLYCLFYSGSTASVKLIKYSKHCRVKTRKYSNTSPTAKFML